MLWGARRIERYGCWFNKQTAVNNTEGAADEQRGVSPFFFGVQIFNGDFSAQTTKPSRHTTKQRMRKEFTI